MNRTSNAGRSALSLKLDGEPVSTVELKRAVLDMIAERFANRPVPIDVAQMALGWAAHDLIAAYLMEQAQRGER